MKGDQQVKNPNGATGWLSGTLANDLPPLTLFSSVKGDQPYPAVLSEFTRITQPLQQCQPHGARQGVSQRKPHHSCRVKNPAMEMSRRKAITEAPNQIPKMLWGAALGPVTAENRDFHVSGRNSAPRSSLPSRTRGQGCTWLQLWKAATKSGFPSQIPLSHLSSARAAGHGPGSRRQHRG